MVGKIILLCKRDHVGVIVIFQCNAIQQREVNVHIVHILNMWDICRRNRKGAAGGIQSSVTQSQETMAAGLVTEPERVSPSPTAVICIPPSPDLGTYPSSDVDDVYILSLRYVISANSDTYSLLCGP